MNREEAIKDFKNKKAKQFVDECDKLLTELFDKNRDKIKEILMQSLENIVKKAEISHKRKEDRITTFQIEILRTEILTESFKICVHGYNIFGYLDESPICEYVNLKFLFEPLMQLKEKLEKEKKIYIGKINSYDIQNMLLKIAVEFYISLANEVRQWLWNLEECEWIKNECVNNFYQIRWGEYHGKSEIVFAMDNRKKSSADFLQLKTQEEAKMPFVYTVWKDSILNNCEIKNRNMLFISFKGSILEQIKFLGCKMLSSQFDNSNIKKCSFEESILIASSFKKSQLDLCSFQRTNLFGVDFSNAKLTNINFNNSNLAKTNFINVEVENLSFENADVSDAVFSSKVVPFLHLSPEQLQTIYIMED